MNETGIVRRVDDLGRIVLPKEVRSKFAISEGTSMELFVSADGILLKKYCPQNALSSMAADFLDAVDDVCVDLGPKKTGDIRRHIREIQKILNQQN